MNDRYRMLDGLRGWAALAVAIGHFVPDAGLFAWPGLRAFTDTRLAVAVFFVLSGFVLSSAYVDRKFTYCMLGANLISRHLRLALPIVSVSLLVTLLYHAGMLYNWRTDATFPEWGYAGFYRFEASMPDALMFGLFDVFFRYDPAHTYIPPAWTMRTELLGSYFVYAALFGATIVGWRRISLPFLSALVVLSLALFYLHFHFVSYFAFGMALAVYYRRLERRAPYDRTALLLFTAVLVYAAYRDADRSAFAVLVMAIACIWAVLESPRLSRFFEARISQFLGRISFPLYLVHVPIYSSFGAALMLQLRDHGVGATTTYLVTLPLSLALVIAVARALEPMEKLAIEASRRTKAGIQNSCARTGARARAPAAG